MNEENVLSDWIAQFIRKETLFLRHFIGQVMTIADPTQAKGVINVEIQELKNIIPSLIPCAPRQNASLVIPNIGDYVEVYFLNGQPERAVYLYPATEMQLMANKAATLDPKLDVLYCSPDSATDSITYQRITQILNIMSKIILQPIPPETQLMGGTEPFVLGTQLVNYLTNFINNVYNLHNHGAAAVPPTILGTPPAGITSVDIMGK